jgi:hypothetical protein
MSEPEPASEPEREPEPKLFESRSRSGNKVSAPQHWIIINMESIFIFFPSMVHKTSIATSFFKQCIFYLIFLHINEQTNKKTTQI